MTPDFDPLPHIYRHPVTKARLAGLTSVLRAAGMGHNGDFSGGWWCENEQAMLRGKRVHAACHYDDEGDLRLDSVLESDRGYLQAWRAAKEFYGIKPRAVEQPVMLESVGMACTPDVIATAKIMGQRLEYVVVERKTGKMPWWTRYQLAGQQMMLPDPYRYTRLAIELHADGTWAVGGPWFASSFAADRRVVEAALLIYRTKEENRAL